MLDDVPLFDLLRLGIDGTLGLIRAALVNGDLVIGALLVAKVFQITLQARLPLSAEPLWLLTHGRANSALSIHLRDFL